MWRRMPRGERQFSTLMFLTPSPPRLTSRSRVEHWLLLLVRAVSLILLVFAFTRPLWRTPITQPDPASNEQLVAILVDTSASLRRAGVWTDLLKQLDDRLSHLPGQAQVALYSFDKQFSAVADFNELKSLEPPARRELVRARLKELKPTWYETQLGEALVRTATALQEAQTERAKPVSQRIWLASDLQTGSEVVALQGFEWPDDLPVELIVAHPASTSNAGVQVVERNQDSGDDVLRVRVTNSSDSLKEQFSLRWDVRESPEIAVYVPPGQSRILTPPPLPTGITCSTLLLKGDDDDFDNRVYIAEALPETRLVVFCGTDRANDTQGARFYLERVFASSHRFQIELKERSEVNLAAAESQPALVVLVEPDAADLPIVQKHLANGGTVLIAGSTVENSTSALKLCGRDDLSVQEATVSNYVMLGEIDFEHPAFAPFAESQFSDFTGIRFWKHRTIKGLKQSGARSSSGPSDMNDRVLARFDDGDPAIVEFAVERGRVILFAAGWQPSDSQFARSSKFPMLMFHLLEQSAGITPRMGSQPVGSELTWPTLSRLESSATGSARLPDGTDLTSLPVDQPFAKTDRPGLYTLSVPGRTEQIAINLAADESRTAPMTLEQLESYGLKLKARERPIELKRQKDRERQMQLAELEESQKLWQRILIAVILILLLETLLTGWFASKQTAELTQPT
jgi:hypothetical protein